VVVCANNIQYVYAGLAPYFYAQLYDHPTVMANIRDYNALISEVAVKNRTYLSGRAAMGAQPCEYGLFIYLKQRNLRSLCTLIDAPRDPDYLRWRDTILDRRRISDLRRRDLSPAAGDAEEADRLYRLLVDATLSLFLDYAVLHEVGHLRNRDLAAAADSPCDVLAREARADTYAERAMLAEKLISTSDDLLIVRTAWAVGSARLTADMLGKGDRDELATRRLLAGLDRTPAILQALQRDQPELAADTARAFASLESLAPLVGEVRAARRCR
jgi:hypothetical protein